MTNKVWKFFQLTGLCGKKNDVLFYSANKSSDLNKLVVFFHGDLQNYEEEMLADDCTKEFVTWSLENSMRLIGDKFPDHVILGVKCSVIHSKQFASYCNFVDYDHNYRIIYKIDFDALQHLEQLILNLKREIDFNTDYQELKFCGDNIDELVIVGFSSGGAIVNQIMISLNELKTDLEASAIRKQNNLIDYSSSDESDVYLSSSMSNSRSFGMSNSLSSSFTDNKMFFDILNEAVNTRLNNFYKKLTKLIWLDLGCRAVGKKVYILDNRILDAIRDLNIELQVHSTPRQIFCNLRQYIGIQEKEFKDRLKDYEKFKRKLYLNRSATIQNHFKLLEDFDPS